MRFIFYCTNCGFTGSDEEHMRTTPAKCPDCGKILSDTSLRHSDWSLMTRADKDALKQKWRKELNNNAKYDNNAKYAIQGARGRSILVYEDKCIISVEPGFGSLITGNALDGAKTIYYCDVISVQFKADGFTLGYMQLETASSSMNNRSSNFFNENTFTFNKLTPEIDDMYTYVKKRVEEYKTAKQAPVITAAPSPADEIRKYKDLLDSGILTQE